MTHREPEPTGGGATSEAQQLARIRDLLFGETARTLDTRVAGVERRLLAELERARFEASDRITAFRAELEAGLVRLGAALERERAATSARHQELGERLDATALVLGQRVEAGDVALGLRVDRVEADVGAALGAARAELSAALALDRAQASERLARVERELRSDLEARCAALEHAAATRTEALGDALRGALHAHADEQRRALAALGDELRTAVAATRSAAVDRVALAADLGALARRLAADATQGPPVGVPHTNGGASPEASEAARVTRGRDEAR